MIKLKPGMRIKCNSEDEAKEFIRIAHKQGFKWRDGNPEDDTTYYQKCNGYIIYILNGDMTMAYLKNDFGFFTQDLYNYSDLKKGEYATMTKADLENGMVVKLRNKGMYLVHNDRLLNKKGMGHMNLYTERGYYDKEYNEDLTRPGDSNWDIIRVYKSYVYNLKDMFDKNNLELIWERKEDKQELSKKDKKVIKKGLKKAQEYCKSLISCKECEFHEGAYCKFDCFSMSTDLDEFFKD